MLSKESCSCIPSITTETAIAPRMYLVMADLEMHDMLVLAQACRYVTECMRLHTMAVDVRDPEADKSQPRLKLRSDRVRTQIYNCGQSVVQTARAYSVSVSSKAMKWWCYDTSTCRRRIFGSSRKAAFLSLDTLVATRRLHVGTSSSSISPFEPLCCIARLITPCRRQTRSKYEIR